MSYDFVVFHCPCLDGVSSAYIAKQTALCASSEFVPYTYSERKTNFAEKFKDKWVLFLDFVLHENEMIEILNVVSRITILDHHKTSLWLIKPEIMEKYGSKIHVDLRQQYSGVQLTWMFFNSFSSESELKNAPWWVNAIADGDLYTWKLSDSEALCTAMDMLNMGESLEIFESQIKSSKLFFETKGEQMLETLTILASNKAKHATVCKLSLPSLHNPEEQAVYNVALVSAPSEIIVKNKTGDILCQNKQVDFAILYSYHPETICFGWSLRGNNRVDCSRIAKQINPRGGGHANAAGCSVKSFMTKDWEGIGVVLTFQ